jgi:hypothetical protein
MTVPAAVGPLDFDMMVLAQQFHRWAALVPTPDTTTFCSSDKFCEQGSV